MCVIYVEDHPIHPEEELSLCQLALEDDTINLNAMTVEEKVDLISAITPLQRFVLTDQEDQKDWSLAYDCCRDFHLVWSKLHHGKQIVNVSPKFTKRDGLMWYEDKICIPYSKRREFLAAAHDSVGHLGGAKTAHRLNNLWWRTLAV